MARSHCEKKGDEIKLFSADMVILEEFLKYDNARANFIKRKLKYIMNAEEM